MDQQHGAPGVGEAGMGDGLFQPARKGGAVWKLLGGVVFADMALALRARAHRQAARRTAVGAAHQPLASPDGATAAASAAPPGAGGTAAVGAPAQRQPCHAGQHEHADGEPDRRQRREGVRQARGIAPGRPHARPIRYPRWPSGRWPARRPPRRCRASARARAAATGPWRPPRHPRRTPQRRPAALAEVQQAAGSQHDPGGHADRGAGTQQEHPLCVADPHLPGMRFPPAAPSPSPSPRARQSGMTSNRRLSIIAGIRLPTAAAR